MSWYNELHDGSLPGISECPNDTDGDGDCHMCHRNPTAHDFALAELIIEEVDALRHHDDGGGVQPWSKGDFYPWVWTCIESRHTVRMFYKHPNGEVSLCVAYDKHKPGLTFKEAHRILDRHMEIRFGRR